MWWELIIWESVALAAIVLLCFTQPDHERSGWVIWGSAFWAMITTLALLVNYLGWFR